MYQREYPPEGLVAASRTYEELGYDDVWFVEDLRFAGGLTSAALALQATASIEVGIGILAAVVRNPVFAAMEIATLARLYPGRLVAGIGHGVQDWMMDVGARVPSPLGALGATLEVVGQLLDGRSVTVEGTYATVRDVALEFPPPKPPVVLGGVRGEKSLELCGRLCDGVLLAEPVTPAYVRWAAQVMSGPAALAGRATPTVAVYALLSVDDDRELAADRLRLRIASSLADPTTHVHLQGLPFRDEMLEECASGPVEECARSLRPEWISALAVSGTPAECADGVAALGLAGASRVVLLPPPGLAAQQAEQFAREVLPLVRAASS